MDEHPDRPFRLAQDPGDLRGAELLHEPQDHRLATLAGQPPDGTPGGASAVIERVVPDLR